MVQVSEKVVKDDGKKNAFLGVDVGSVSHKVVLMDTDGSLLTSVFLLNRGSPIDSVKDGMAK